MTQRAEWDNLKYKVDFNEACLVNTETGAQAPFLISSLYSEALNQACGLLAVAGPDSNKSKAQQWLDFFMNMAAQERDEQELTKRQTPVQRKCCGGGCHSESDDDSGLL